jgi:hypothetical protein
MFSFSPTSIKLAIQPRAAYTDFTPAGPWTDGTAVTRNSDGVGFTYSAALNALSINPNLSASVKDANNFTIQNLPGPIRGGDAVNKSYVDRLLGILTGSASGVGTAAAVGIVTMTSSGFASCVGTANGRSQ